MHPPISRQKEPIVESPGAKRTTYLTLLLLVFGSMGLFGGGCGTTRFVEMWNDSSYSAGPLSKILVISFRPDPVQRRISEDAFVATLQKRNTAAVSSYQLFPEAIPDTTALRQTIEKERFDGVLVLVSAEREKIETYVPGYTTREEVTTFDRRWKEYVTRQETVQHEGYTETVMAIRLQTDLSAGPGRGTTALVGDERNDRPNLSSAGKRIRCGTRRKRSAEEKADRSEAVNRPVTPTGPAGDGPLDA